MIKIKIPEKKNLYDESENRFFSTKEVELQLEHSLISLQAWESKWHKPFLETKDKSFEEIIDYIRHMTIMPKNIDPRIYYLIPQDEMAKVMNYLTDPSTATWFTDGGINLPGMHKNEVITAEIIYYWMITLNIPPEYRKWHLNQLITLIKTISIKNTKQKPMSRNEEMQQRHALNKARRAKYNSRG